MAYDIHIILGQSQQAGAISDGTPVTSASFQTAWGYPNDTSGIDELSDSLSTFNSPSRWHAFANEWQVQTGVESIYIDLVTGGSALIKEAAGANGYWDTREAGNLYDGKLATFNTMLEVIARSPRFSGPQRRFVHWDLGGTDALNVNGTTVTGALYQAALENLVTQALSDFGSSHFLIGRLGLNAALPLDTDYDDIRNAQIAVAAGNSSVDIIFDKATEGTALLVVDGNGEWVSGWDYSDNFHYTGPAYKAAGIMSAKNLAALL